MPAVAKPVVSAPTEVTSTVRLFAECVNVDSMERPVRLTEKEVKVKHDGTKEEIISYHDCMRRVYTYEFEVDPSPLSHPRATIKMESLTPLAFERKKSYCLSVV